MTVNRSGLLLARKRHDDALGSGSAILETKGPRAGAPNSFANRMLPAICRLAIGQERISSVKLPWRLESISTYRRQTADCDRFAECTGGENKRWRILTRTVSTSILWGCTARDLPELTLSAATKGKRQTAPEANLRRGHVIHSKSRANSATFNSVITKGGTRPSLRSRRTVGIEASPWTFAKDVLRWSISGG